MNCANHADITAVAYCRTCGKPLCAPCARDVRGVIYCEHCLAERLEGTVPPGVVPTPGVPVVASSGPNPALAGILGAIPFGVGAVYNGQYAKGLAHLVIFCLLVFGANTGEGMLGTVCGIGIAFFVLYQIIDSVRTAHAIQAGQPAPDPLGLGQAFGAGEKLDTSKVPMAAIVLIGLGVLFLLQTSGIFGLSFDRIWPVLLIFLGLWLFAKRLGVLGDGLTWQDRRPRRGSFAGPAVLVAVGLLSLIENLHGPGWDRTWPVLLLAIGLAKLFDHKTAPQFPPDQNGPGPGNNLPGEMQPPASASSGSEVKNG
jgi:hypothetical protein